MLLHLSDLHFGTELPERVQAVQNFCEANRPELVIVSGDLTQRARFQQFYMSAVFRKLKYSVSCRARQSRYSAVSCVAQILKSVWALSIVLWRNGKGDCFRAFLCGRRQ